MAGLEAWMSASPLKNAFHASAWYLSTYRVMLKEYSQSHGISLRSPVNSLPSEKNETDGGFSPLAFASSWASLCCPSIVFQTKRAGACLSGQAPCVGLGAWQKPVDDVAVCGSFAHAVGPSAQGSSGAGKAGFPSRDHYIICPNCQGL